VPGPGTRFKGDTEIPERGTTKAGQRNDPAAKDWEASRVERLQLIEHAER